MTEESKSKKQAAIEAFVEFLKQHNLAEDIVEVYRVFRSVDLHDDVVDTFDAATRRFLDANPKMRFRLAELTVVDREPRIRLETYYILQPLIFTDELARTIIWDQLLSDEEDPTVLKELLEWLEEELLGASDVPLVDILYAAERFATAKEKYNKNPAS